MSVFRLVIAEIRHRKMHFGLSLLAVIIVTGYAVCMVSLIDAQQRRTAERVAKLDDEIRKITKAMGFNINVLPADQNLQEFYANDFAEKTMPFEYVQRLADSRDIVTINHLQASLIRKVSWPEYDRQIILLGVSGVIPWTHRSNPKKPLAEAIPQGEMVLGSVLADELSLKQGDSVQFRGAPFTIGKIHPARGTQDDITAWIDLATAQEMLQLPDRINLIQALECNCASVDRLAEIQQEISQVLGGNVQVIELSGKAIARARAREDVRREGERTNASMRQRALLHVVLLAISGCVVIGLLMMLNVRQRLVEIGTLRAIGVRTSGILALFLWKALLIGVVGASLGFLGGFLLAQGFDARELAGDLESLVQVQFDQRLLMAVLALAPLLSLLASWIPATVAAGQDPAVVLSQS